MSAGRGLRKHRAKDDQPRPLFWLLFLLLCSVVFGLGLHVGMHTEATKAGAWELDGPHASHLLSVSRGWASHRVETSTPEVATPPMTREDLLHQWHAAGDAQRHLPPPASPPPPRVPATVAAVAAPPSPPPPPPSPVRVAAPPLPSPQLSVVVPAPPPRVPAPATAAASGTTTASKLPAAVLDSAPESWRSLMLDASLQAAISSQLSRWRASAPGPIEAFLDNGGRLPVAVLAANRPDMLKDTLTSLLAVRGIRHADVLVVQDGSDVAVTQVARDFNFEPKQNVHAKLRGAALDGAKRIAQHYKFALSHAFTVRPEAPAIIVVEDDFLFSPDFLDYFHSVGPLLEHDPTTFVLSAWNDNGLKGHVSDKRSLCRTGFFPGLGWMLSRRLWASELERAWPAEHWDHWMRDPKQHKGREAIFPEVNRDYHAGKKGTFMDDYHHNRYFKNIDYNQDESFRWTSDREMAAPPYLFAISDVYEAYLRALLASPRTVHLNSIEQLEGLHEELDTRLDVVLWHDTVFTPPGGASVPAFRPLADYLNIWHEWYRTAHQGCLHRMRWRGHQLVLVNMQSGALRKDVRSPYADLKPAAAKVFNPNDFKERKRPVVVSKALQASLRTVAAHTTGLSCDTVCQQQSLRCEQTLLPLVNTCDQLNAAFPCTSCEENYGFEQPAFVVPTASAASLPSSCLVSSKPQDSTCSASHVATRRLCACVGAPGPH